MNLNCKNSNRRAGERGFYLVVVMLIMASIMLIYLAVNTSRLGSLKKELRLVEQKQIERLNRSAAVATNSVPVVIPNSTP
jgi:hypothetical protein